MQIFEAKMCNTFLKLFVSCMIFTTLVRCSVSEKCEKINRGLDPTSNYRLLNVTVPRHYKVNITLTPSKPILFGECAIEILISNETPIINLHVPYTHSKYGQNTFLSKVQLVGKLTEKTCEVRNYTYVPDLEILNIYFEEKLKSGVYVLSISYNYAIDYSNEEGGLFMASIPFKGHEPKSVIATNVQSIETRRLFPCWDEPALRATFEINIRHKKEYRFWPMLENCTENYQDDWIWTRYKATLHPVSTSHMAFALATVPLISNNKQKFNTIWNRPNDKRYFEFAQNVIDKILYSRWYRMIPPSVPDIKQFAIPAIQHDIIDKGGLIIYKEALVIYDNATDNVAQKMEVARTISRAMVHQSIDNAISPSWWSHAWLNEGLAILLHANILSEIYPRWRSEDLFAIQLQHECFRLDSKSAMKPLTYEVKTPSEITSFFSFPVYVKAPVILRMVRHMIGRKFQEIIGKYLSKNQFKSSKPDDLWDMMPINVAERSCNYTTRNIMENWLENNSYPIVQVRRDRNKFIIFEKNYYIDDMGYVREYWHNWWIPITLTSSWELNFADMTPSYWIAPKCQETDQRDVIIPFKNDDDWIILNLQQTGYYRVMYDIKSLKLITRYLNSDRYQSIHVLNRAQIIDDTYYFCITERYPCNLFWHLTKYLSRETNYIAWYPMFQIFRDIAYVLPFEQSKPLKNHVGNILSKILDKLSYNKTRTENDLTEFLRQEAARWACNFDDSKCQQTANVMLKRHLEDPEKYKISPGWQQWTYCEGLMKADEDTLQALENALSNRTGIFNYTSCSRKSGLVVRASFHTLFNENNKRLTLSHHKVLVDYGMERMGRLLAYFQEHNTSISYKLKILCITINHAYSEEKLDQLRTIASIIFDDNVLQREMVNGKAQMRLEKINAQKESFVPLLRYI